MAEYIVNSQNENLLAVKEGELKAEKKLQERLEKLFEAKYFGGNLSYKIIFEKKVL